MPFCKLAPSPQVKISLLSRTSTSHLQLVHNYVTYMVEIAISISTGKSVLVGMALLGVGSTDVVPCGGVPVVGAPGLVSLTSAPLPSDMSWSSSSEDTGFFVFPLHRSPEQRQYSTSLACLQSLIPFSLLHIRYILVAGNLENINVLVSH